MMPGACLVVFMILAAAVKDPNANNKSAIVTPTQPDSESKEQKENSAPQTSLNQNILADIDDPNYISDLEPNQTLAEIAQTIKTDEQEPAEFADRQKRSGKYWQQKYHHQVTGQVFLLLNYLYYPGGLDYAVPQADLSKDQALPAQKDTAPTTNRDDSAASRHLLEKCCDLIYQWRSTNDSASTALEVVRAMELTKTATGIYRINPALAVEVKRSIGQIRRINRKFDIASRMALESALSGKVDKDLLSRMEKQISGLNSLLERLAQQNDAASIALGAGPIDRNQNNEAIDYTKVVPPTQY